MPFNNNITTLIKTPIMRRTLINPCCLIFVFLLGYRAGYLHQYLNGANTQSRMVKESVLPEVLSKRRRPLQIFPLLKDLRCGWGNKTPQPLVKKDASGQRSLVLDVGLDQGKEFFDAMRSGFEVVGFEPNPVTFPKLKAKCLQDFTNCNIVDLNTTELPLKRLPGNSYLINAAAGEKRESLSLFGAGAASSFQMEGDRKGTGHSVPVVRVDEIIDEDVYLFKIDAQGYDQHVLEGARNLFAKHVVRQVIAEVDPWNLSKSTHSPRTMLDFLQNVAGMVCFQARTDQMKECMAFGESIDAFEEVFKLDPVRHKMWNKCWEDFVCVNVEKEYTGNHPPN